MLANNQELNVSEIAYDLGFSSPRYFNKCFKDLFGCAPIEYRKNNTKH
jgi:AraC-like DNA-binding protein